MIGPINAKMRKPMSGAGMEPVTIVGFVTVGAGQLFGVFIGADGRLHSAELDRFSDCWMVDNVTVETVVTHTPIGRDAE